MLDTFAEELPPGAVIGSPAALGGVRLGRDTEGILSIDNGALRIAPPRVPGWGRHGVAYGPLDSQSGLTLAVRLLNGHNNSQTSRDRRPLHRKVARFLKRMVLLVVRSYKAPPVPFDHPDPQILDNLSVGWYGSDSPADPTREGAAFVVTAARAENSVLSVAYGGRRLPVVRGLQNLQVCYIVLLREEGVAYYLASVRGANGCGGYPLMRPLAIDPTPVRAQLYPGIHQSVLGEVGFLVDTRIHRVRAAVVPALASWYGTAHAADRLVDDGELARRPAELGGSWSDPSGAFVCTARGVRPTSRGVAYLDPGTPSGLIGATLTITGSDEAGIVWRLRDPDHFWCVRVGPTATRLFRITSGEWSEIAQGPGTADERPHHLQIQDDGRTIQLSLDGEPVLDAPLVDDQYHDGTGVGLLAVAPADGTFVRDFEAHPREVPIPTELDLGGLWEPAVGPLAVADDFSGPASELVGTGATPGSPAWRRLLGRGRIDRTGEGEVRVRATPERPSPGRTAYTIDWGHPEFADLSAAIVLPGSGRGMNVTGRPGFIFHQDADNYLIVSVWNADRYEGGAVSAFFRLDGRERLDRAVWTNIADRFTWGVPFRLRVSFDGMQLLAYLEGEPVLYRTLSDVYPPARRLHIREVGLVANWEYGEDMGSRFRSFEARGPLHGVTSGLEPTRTAPPPGTALTDRARR